MGSALGSLGQRKGFSDIPPKEETSTGTAPGDCWRLGSTLNFACSGVGHG